ncbi:MAG TPA: hypothetical protein VE974_24300 [Thermoanaerobaculia bacterium]|nr:hypothetical protein [Thermoanaerobaculia bacterium]
MEPKMGNTNERPSSEEVSTRLTRIAELSRKMSGTALTTLAHHIDVNLMQEAFGRVRRGGAAGIDGVTAEGYEANLETNLSDLLKRFKSGTY